MKYNKQVYFYFLWVFALNILELSKILASPSQVGGILIEVSLGELIDKITILEIKSERIKDTLKLENIKRELSVLNKVLSNIKYQFAALKDKSNTLSAYHQELKQINEILWDTENNIRKKEQEKRFDSEFIALARNVYHTNDRRSLIKRKINELFNSELKEEKEYTTY